MTTLGASVAVEIPDAPAPARNQPVLTLVARRIAGPLAQALLAWLLRQEGRFSSWRKRLWRGSSLLAVARKMERHVEN